MQQQHFWFSVYLVFKDKGVIIMSNNNNNFGFSTPNFAQPGKNTMDQNQTPDFASMSKQEIKAYDAAHGSYKRILGDKPISWLWLMNHYSAANAAAYKEQQERKKTGASAGGMNVPNNGTNASNNEKSILNNGMNGQVGYQQQTNGHMGNMQGGYQKPANQNDGYSNSGYQNFRNQNNGYSNNNYQNPANQNEGYPGNRISTYPEEDFLDDGGTVVMDRDLLEKISRIPARIYCVAFNQDVEIKKVPFTIGRSRQNIDLCIHGNANMGRRHAEITYRDGSYFIEDLNSVNHVFVNSRKIEANVPYRLKANDKFMLANEEFVFRLEE